MNNKVLVSSLALSMLIVGSGVSAFASDSITGNIKDAVNKAVQETKGADTNVREESYEVKQAMAAPMVSSFPDVQEGQWFYNVVMKMTQIGLFKGYEDGEFKPENKMTRAEFMSVVARILELDTSNESNLWYEASYYALVDNGVISESEIPFETKILEGDITRQEMAMIALRAIQARGETISSVYTSNVKASIPDFAQVGNYYIDFVVKAYENGILTGDNTGAFKPLDSLKRSEAATVINKIMDSSAREHKDFSQVSASHSNNVSSSITIKENEPRSNRLAKEGDTYIKADGTVLTITKGPHGIVAEGMGIAPDLGLIYNSPQGSYVLQDGDKALTDQYGDSSVGVSTASSNYWVNPLTHEGHWDSEWLVIQDYTYPQTEGTDEGEVSADKNYIWDGMDWVLLACPNGQQWLE